jgi:hypothetical protein
MLPRLLGVSAADAMNRGHAACEKDAREFARVLEASVTTSVEILLFCGNVAFSPRRRQ